MFDVQENSQKCKGYKITECASLGSPMRDGFKF